ncbi:MAG: hypothetical protein B7X40_01940 [Cellulomonas sp. 14-74-6]|nr:MAG: hypothetical protein B7X40_01940 [Cellulomonas sp. 14-74-6]
MTPKTVVTSALKYVTLVVASIAMLLPIALILTGSFKTGQEFLTTGPFAAPGSWTNLANYRTAWVRGGMALGFLNTALPS